MSRGSFPRVLFEHPVTQVFQVRAEFVGEVGALSLHDAVHDGHEIGAREGAVEGTHLK